MIKTLHKNTKLTIIFYVVYFSLAFILEKLYPSGPCTPSFGILMFIFFPFISVTILIISLINYFYNKDKSLKISIFIHTILLILFLIYFIVGINV